MEDYVKSGACLSQESRQLLDEALAVTHYYGPGKNSFRIAVADFLFYVDSRKIASDSEISYPLLKEYLLNLKEMWSHDAYRERLNYIFSFMAFIKSGMEAELFSAYHGNSRLIFTEELEPEIQARISKIHSDIGEVTETVPNAYVRVNSTLENKVKAINSEAYTKYKARWNSFFLFLTLNELSLSEEIITIWHQIAGSQSTPLLRYVFSKENTSTKNSSPLTVFLGIPEEMGSQGFFSIKSRRQPEDSLPCWSRDLLIEYLDVERKRGKAETTIQTQRYACVKFLIFAELNGVQSCEEVTPQLLNEYS